jgi:hypothetical protein
MQQVLLTIFYLIGAAFSWGVAWIIWPFLYRLWRDRKRSN